MKLVSIALALASIVPALVSAVTLPNADTPLFYLVATGPESSGVNHLPLRLRGGTNWDASLLTGDGPIGKFHFWQGRLVAPDLNNQFNGIDQLPYINTQQTGAGSCATHGRLQITQAGGSTNKCASWNSFWLHSNEENSQLGAKLTFNWRGDFYVCGADKQVYYKVDAADGPQDCVKIDLYTVPVVA